MSGKRMQKRRCKDGSYRFRGYHFHEDQLETIERAIERARQEMSTDFDSVALEAICMGYLAGSTQLALVRSKDAAL